MNVYKTKFAESDNVVLCKYYEVRYENIFLSICRIRPIINGLGQLLKTN